MSLTSGLRLTVLAGPTLPAPLTVDLAERETLAAAIRRELES